MILIIDHYDSFTYNLYQFLGELGEEMVIARYDKISIDEIKEMNPKAIILSPGPGKPEEKQETNELIQTFYKTVPILGICLGHQAIGYAFGAKIIKARQIKHGKTSKIRHDGSNLFAYMSQPLEVMRYHSLVIEKETIPPLFETLAFAMDDQEIMAIKHRKYPIYGMQFHPESIGTEYGKQLLLNFLNEIKEELKDERVPSTLS
ncbi:anthranilate synthase component II [Gottfriedia acidiceleris]|uniref:Aminodeoxychorismate/anthranilate synthase component II n=1 Tax=Gottfriedia acidiceleris TaxID=371036 RepID=A0ABY4JJS8_9BACI|nr:aminodeoxychorismate/anthranilate synthase component II [Gottfriedia acidiceleris]UPM54106.1 aminodeoxychorismate/anthranilate synthase component II [Gottfriedia acidiceleris]